MEQHELISAEFTRRRFIKGAGAAAVAVGVMGTSTGIASAAKVAAPKKGGTLKLGVVGGANDVFDAQYIVAKAATQSSHRRPSTVLPSPQRR